MKTSRTNSFRLHRITKTSSLKKPNQTFYDADESFKLAALNTVNKGVKHADISFMTGQNLNKLRVEPLEANEGPYLSAHDNLSQVRKKYDDMKKQNGNHQNNISKLKEQHNKLKIFQNQYQGKIDVGKSKVTTLQQDLQDKKNLVQICIMEKRVLQMLESRHKQDKIVFDQRKFNGEKQLGYFKKQLNIYKKEGIEVDEEGDRTSKIYAKLSKENEEEKYERDLHINNLENMIYEKEALIGANHERQRDLGSIAEKAMQDKDFNEKQWRKIFQTHTFVNRMLRDKIEKQMEKFRVVEFAFKSIKTATGVNDAKQLVVKYLNKEQVYGELLGKIADNQKTIDHLKSETENLMKQSKELEIELEILQTTKVPKQDLHDDIKLLETYDEKATTVEQYRTKISQWLMRQLKKIVVISHQIKAEELEQLSEKNNLKLSVQKFLTVISSHMDDINQQQITLPSAANLAHKDLEKNTRVIPKRARRNSSGQDVFDVDEEETNPNSSTQQMELINSQREELLRNNEKFMKELAKKKQQEMRIMIDKLEADKKKATKAPQPKKQEDEN